MKLHTKYQRPGIQVSDKKNFKFSVKKSICSSCDQDVQMDRNHLNNFERGSTNNHSCEVCSKSNKWFRGSI